MTHAMDDATLLRRHAETGDEAAFAELVRRHADLVYSAARRQTSDHHRAQEVTQMVFVALARKAATLARHPVLVAWLFRSTRLAAAKLHEAERRRVAREDAAAQRAEAEAGLVRPGVSAAWAAPDAADAPWERVAPCLDEALATLGERERAAVLLRFFQQRSYAEVGAALGVAENAARMRTERALDKLRAALARRGVRSTAEALGLALGAQAVSAAPAGVAPAALAAVLASGAGAAAGSGMVATAGVFFMKQVKLVGVAVVAAGLASWATYELVSRENRVPVAAALTTQGAPTTAAAPAEDARAAELEAENAALRARLAAAEERATRGAAELKAARNRLAELRRPLELDTVGSVLRAEGVRPGEVVVTGGSRLPNGRRFFVFATPTSYVPEVAGAGRQHTVKIKVIAVSDEAAGRAGLDDLSTSGENTLQHGFVWSARAIDEAERTLAQDGDVETWADTGYLLRDGFELPFGALDLGRYENKRLVKGARIGLKPRFRPEDGSMDLEMHVEAVFPVPDDAVAGRE